MYIERELKSIKTEQSRLPKKYFDYSRYENLITDLYDLDEKRADHIIAKIYFDYLCIIYCGCYIKFEFFDKAHLIQDGQLQSINASFSESVEIFKILETAKKYCC